MKNFLLLFALLVQYFLSGVSYAQNQDTTYLKFCVYALADDSMGGRKPGTKYEQMAADFIAEQFRSNKVRPFLDKEYFQKFSYTYDSCNYNSRNIIGCINNKAKENIVIGAHYDHIGFGGKRSRSFGSHEVHNGADDNASGVALMLDLAKNLKKGGPKKYNYFFIAFSGHEDGLFGSSYFIKSNIIDVKSIKLMINLDMVGRADKTAPTLFIASNDSLLQTKALSFDVSPLKIKSKELPLGDHSAFDYAHIPLLFLSSGTHDDYHKTTDDAQYVNYSGMSYIERYIISFLKKL